MFAFVATEILRLFVIRWKLTKAHFLVGAQRGVVTRFGCLVRAVTSVEGMNPYSFCSLLSPIAVSHWLNSRRPGGQGSRHNTTKDQPPGHSTWWGRWRMAVDGLMGVIRHNEEGRKVCRTPELTKNCATKGFAQELHRQPTGHFLAYSFLDFSGQWLGIRFGIWSSME